MIFIIKFVMGPQGALNMSVTWEEHDYKDTQNYFDYSYLLISAIFPKFMKNYY